MDAAVEAAAGELCRRLLAEPPALRSTRVLAIDGRSGAGKSTLARVLAAELRAPTVELEALYGGWDGLRAGADRLVDDVLAPLEAAGAAQVPEWDWLAGAWRAPWRLEAPPVLVVEGVGAGILRAAPFTSLVVWLEVDAAERRRRTRARDHGLYDDAAWARWSAQEEELLAADPIPRRAGIVLTLNGA